MGKEGDRRLSKAAWSILKTYSEFDSDDPHQKERATETTKMAIDAITGHMNEGGKEVEEAFKLTKKLKGGK